MYSDRIKELRTKTGLSQGDFAKAISSSVNSISRYELGKGNPQKKVIERICEVFGVDEEWLMGEAELAPDFVLPEIEVETTPKKKPGRKKKEKPTPVVTTEESATAVDEEIIVTEEAAPAVDEEEAAPAPTEEEIAVDEEEEITPEDITDVDDEEDESPTIEVEITADEEESAPAEEPATPVDEEEAAPEIEIKITVDEEEPDKEPAEPSSTRAEKITNKVREIADQFADILDTVLEKAKPEQQLSLTLENHDGRQLSYAALINKVHTVAPDATAAFIKPSENKIYFVTPNSAGSIDLF